jgi:pyruvate,water dikinase
LVASAGGGTSTLDIPEPQRDLLCLSDLNLKSLDRLAEQCVRIFGGPQDIEWAIEGDRTFLLQSRPITTTSKWLATKAE